MLTPFGYAILDYHSNRVQSVTFSADTPELFQSPAMIPFYFGTSLTSRGPVCCAQNMASVLPGHLLLIIFCWRTLQTPLFVA